MAASVSREEFVTLLRSTLPHARFTRVGVGLSGGADSTALALLLGEAGLDSQSIVAMQIDHALRAESATEVRHCRQWCRRAGLAHVAHRLEWPLGPPSPSLIQSEARSERWSALLSLCHEHSVSHLFMAHHVGDCRETFLHRLARGSGLRGLARNIPPVSERDSVTVVRPLLTVEKPRLEATCRRFDVQWCEDPSNANTNYERIRIREALRNVASHDASLMTMLDKMPRVLTRVNDGIENHLQTLLQKYAEVDAAEGRVRVRMSVFDEVSEELCVILVSEIVSMLKQAQYSPRHATVVNTVRAIRYRQSAGGRSWLCHGCVLTDNGHWLHAVTEDTRARMNAAHRAKHAASMLQPTPTVE